MAGDCTSSMWEIAHNEARRVVVAQNDTISDIDEKAMRSVRLTTIIVGVLVATIELTAVSPNRGLLALSLSLLVVSMIGGISVYDESDLFLGPQIKYLATLDIEHFEEWFEKMIHTYGELSIENRAAIRWNARLLRVMNVSLIGGIVVALAAMIF